MNPRKYLTLRTLMFHPQKQRDMNKHFKILGFLVLIGLVGCEKNKDTYPSGIYLKKVYYHKNADQVRLFKYNSDGQLVQRDFLFNDVIGERFEFRRDNHKTSIKFYMVKSPYDYTLISKDRLDINFENDRITHTNYYSVDDETEVLFFYDGNDNRINNITYHTKLFMDETEMVIEEYFDYDDKGNIIKVDNLREGVLFSTTVYEYDNYLNPYYQVDPINNSFSKIDIVSYFSPNNPKSSCYIYPDDDTLSITEYHYEYNSDGYPSVSWETIDSKYDTNDYDSTGTKFFEYEIK